MEFDNMGKYAVATLVLSAIVLTTLAVVAQFSVTLRQETSVTDTTLEFPAENATAQYSDYPYFQSVDSCIDATNASNTLTLDTDFSVLEGDADGGYITLLYAGKDWAADDINCSITYLADTTAQASADKFTVGLSVFATFIGVIVLAIIGKIVIGLFKKE